MAGMDGIATGEAIHALGLTPPPHLLIVTAYGREEVFSMARSAGFDEVLVKPVAGSVLFDTLLRLIGPAHAAPERAAEPAAAGEPPPHFDGQRVLVVEDNALNRQVAAELLADFGLQIEVAEDGAEALRKIEAAPPALVFMDMQMPVMDGLEATRRLRADPRWARLSVVAMTANAMEQDRQVCLAAGMNDFVPKPIDPQQLARVLKQWLSPARTQAPPASPPTAVETLSLPGIDIADGLAHCGGNRQRYLAALRRFRDEHGEDAQRIAEALARGQRDEAQRMAHTLKGLCGLVGARDAADAARRMEDAAREGGADAEALLAALRETLAPTLAALLQLPAELPEQAGSTSSKPGPASSETLQRLSALLAGAEAEALEFWRQHAAEFRPALADRHEAIGHAIQRFEFARALRLIQGGDAA